MAIASPAQDKVDRSLGEMQLPRFISIVGSLPPGFSLELFRGHLSLYYDGPGFKRLVQPGGKKPGAEDHKAHVCSHATRCPEDKLRDFMQEWAQKTLQALGLATADTEPTQCVVCSAWFSRGEMAVVSKFETAEALLCKSCKTSLEMWLLRERRHSTQH